MVLEPLFILYREPKKRPRKNCSSTSVVGRHNIYSLAVKKSPASVIYGLKHARIVA